MKAPKQREAAKLGPTQVPSVSRKRRGDIQKVETKRLRRPRVRGPVYPVQVYQAGSDEQVLFTPLMGKRAISEWRGSYDAYLRSDHWRKTKRRLVKTAKNVECFVCGGASPRMDVHHCSYERVGRESVADLVLLCRPCHKRLHKRFDINHKEALKNAHRVLASERGR